jgi:hypothetical protein
MHAHRTAGPPAGVAHRDTPEFEHQRRLVLELVVAPPPNGDELDALARQLEISSEQLERAAAVLERAGLCVRRESRLFASDQLQAVEYLWPIAL